MTTQTGQTVAASNDLWSDADRLKYMSARAQAAGEPVLAVMLAAAKQAAMIGAKRQGRVHGPAAVDPPRQTTPAQPEPVVVPEPQPAAEPPRAVAIEKPQERQPSPIADPVEPVTAPEAIEVEHPVNQTPEPEERVEDPVLNIELDVQDDADTRTAHPIADAPTVDMYADIDARQVNRARRTAGVALLIAMVGYLAAGLAGYVKLPHKMVHGSNQPLESLVPSPTQTQHLTTQIAEPASPAKAMPTNSADASPADGIFAPSTKPQPADEAPQPTLFGKDDDVIDLSDADEEASPFAEAVSRWIRQNRNRVASAPDRTAETGDKQFAELPAPPQWVVQMINQAFESPSATLQPVADTSTP